MDYKAFDKLRREYNHSEVVSRNTTTYGDRSDQTDEDVTTVERQVEGKLAEDVRKRLNADHDAAVLVVETQRSFWISEMTGDNDFKMTIKCNGVEKTFNKFSASENFKALLSWLDEDPEVV